MQVIVLNADHTQINIVSWKRAFNLIEKGKAEVLKYSDNIVSNYSGSKKFHVPAIVKLVTFVKSVYKNTIKFSKRFLHIRDNKTCAYCGCKGAKMSVDHVHPLSRGGKTTWLNCVSSCGKCNHKKADKTLAESGMTLLFKPYAPTTAQFLKCKLIASGLELVY